MVEEKLEMEREVLEIFEHIENGNNFLLSGGAGSGKTYSLVQVIQEIIRKNPTAIIACMTFTNAAVKEIEDRVNHKNLQVTTIHDFLWGCIKSFQKEIKRELVGLLNDGSLRATSISGVVALSYYDSLPMGVQYKEWVDLKEGIISHDELLLLSERMFAKYSLLNQILKDKYKFILIDEYQDTSKEVVRILLQHLRQSTKKNIVGFFGDAMQSIYDDGIGDLNDYKGDENWQVKEVKKSQNRRSPQKVIDLANYLRSDGITQVPSNDANAPNMLSGKVKEGKVLFLHSADADISLVKQILHEKYQWNFDEPKITKELNLTHNLIAEKAGFKELMAIYDKDHILSYKERIRKFIKENHSEIDFSDMTFQDVITHLKSGKSGRELNAVSPTEGMQVFIKDNPDLFATALNSNYETFAKIYVDKDQLIDDKKQSEDDDKKKGSKRDNLIRHLFKIQSNIQFYTDGKYNDFLKATDYRFKIRRLADKKILKENIETLIEVADKTIEQVINEADELGICLIDDKLRAFKEKHEYIYNRVKEVKFSQFQNLFKYLEGKTPFSTQHKTKGREFDNVLVILDNGGWNNYNFQNLFLNTGSPSVLERTRKIFYVCCTRAKENLAVFFHSPLPAVISQAEVWFGVENVLEVKS